MVGAALTDAGRDGGAASFETFASFEASCADEWSVGWSSGPAPTGPDPPPADLSPASSTPPAGPPSPVPPPADPPPAPDTGSGDPLPAAPVRSLVVEGPPGSDPMLDGVVRAVTRTRAGLPMKPKVEGTGSSRTSTSTWSERRPSWAAAAVTAAATVLALASAWATRLALSGRAAARPPVAAGSLPAACALAATTLGGLRLGSLGRWAALLGGCLAVACLGRAVAVLVAGRRRLLLGAGLGRAPEHAQGAKDAVAALAVVGQRRRPGGRRLRVGPGGHGGAAQEDVLLPHAPEVGRDPVDDDRQGHVDREDEEHQRHDPHDRLLLRVHLGGLLVHQLTLGDVGGQRHGRGQDEDRDPGRREELVPALQPEPVLLQGHAEEGLAEQGVRLAGDLPTVDDLVEGEEERHLGEERPAAGHGVEAALLVERHHLLVELRLVVLVLGLELLDLGGQLLHDARRLHLLARQRDEQDPHGDRQHDDREPVALGAQERLDQVLEELQDVVERVAERVEDLDHEEPLSGGPTWPALTTSPYPLRPRFTRPVAGGT